MFLVFSNTFFIISKWLFFFPNNTFILLSVESIDKLISSKLFKISSTYSVSFSAIKIPLVTSLLIIPFSFDNLINSLILGYNTASPPVHVKCVNPLLIRLFNTFSFSSKDKSAILLNPKQYLHPWLHLVVILFLIMTKQ